jgi:hypothetical protein
MLFCSSCRCLSFLLSGCLSATDSDVTGRRTDCECEMCTVRTKDSTVLYCTGQSKAPATPFTNSVTGPVQYWTVQGVCLYVLFCSLLVPN